MADADKRIVKFSGIELLCRIDEKIESLNENDTEATVWWFKFKNYVNDLIDVKYKEQCKSKAKPKINNHGKSRKCNKKTVIS